MQRYRWPGYEIQLLGELQRQQNNAQFCDTMLHTEGISVPTHSCILAALSPYLSKKLSASPSPPLGQKRQLQLQAVKAQTLLKLVGLLYSGELEVKGSVERNDVLSAARQFGITDLVEGQKGEPLERILGSCREGNESRKMQDAQVQAEMAGRRETDSPIEKRSCVSTGTQTVKAGEKTVDRPFAHSDQTRHPEPASSGAQSLDISMSLQSQNIQPEKHSCSIPNSPPISSMHNGAGSDGESTANQSSDTGTNQTSALSSNMMALPVSLNDDSNSPVLQEDSTYQQSSEFRHSIQLLAEEGMGFETGKTNGITADNRENKKQPRHRKRDETITEEKENSTEKRHARAGMKSLAKMKEMQQMELMETAQISIKVKLRRRTKEEVWEVVGMQDTDETLSVLASLKQNGCNHKRPRKGLTNSEPPPPSVQPGPVNQWDNVIFQPATTDSSEPPPQHNHTSDSQLLSSDCCVPNQNDGLESVPLPQPLGPPEECDEQIEKLLEDIMIGLNILPNLEMDCKKSQYLQPNHEGAPAVCQVPVTENEGQQSQMHAGVSAAGHVFYQDTGTHIGHSSTATAPNQPSRSSRPSVPPAAVLIQQPELPQCSPQYHSSVTSMEQRDGTSHKGMPLSKSPNGSYPEAVTTASVIPIPQKLLTTLTYYPACQEQSSQDNQNIFEILPLMNGHEALSSHSLPCMDDLRLPPCLSPLEPSTSEVEYPPALHHPVNQSENVQPSLHGLPWLTVNPGSLQFPLNAITHSADKNASSPQDTNSSSVSEQKAKHLDVLPQNGGAVAASCTVEEDTRKKRKKKCFECNRGDAAVHEKRKRKLTSPPPEVTSLLAYKDVKVSDETQGQISLNVCSVRLSSNNVLAKEREMAASSLNLPNKFLGKPNEPSGPGELRTDKTRIRTRAFLKTFQKTESNSSIENAVLKPVAFKAPFENKKGVPSRGRGRPRKTEVKESPPESSPAITEKPPLEKSILPKEDSEKAKKRCKKRRNRSEVGAIPLKTTVEAEADNHNDVIPAEGKLEASKRPRMVTLRDFQKLIKRQHSKTRKSKESQDKETNKTAIDAEREGKACGSRSEESTKETEMDIAQPVDKNHNQIFNKSTAEFGNSQQDDTNGSTSKETRLFGEKLHPVFSLDLFGEDMAKLTAEREQPMKDPPDEAPKACDAETSDTVRSTAINNEGSSLSDNNLPQQDKTPLDVNLNPQTPDRTGPPPQNAVGCDQEEEEEEEEVDILLYSPDKVPQTGQREDGLDNVEIPPEEEEEEDVIDVTGD